MKFVLAPDKYKGSLTGQEFCNAVEKGIKKVFPKAAIVKLPLADGGDGTIEVVKNYLNADLIKLKVADPLFRSVVSSYLLSSDKKTAFIEMSEASGFKLLQKNELNASETTTFGTGELIEDALNKGAQEIILGIGGSATNDGGMGMASALGFEFLDSDGNTLSPVGKNLGKVAKIKKDSIHRRIAAVKVKVASDVSNPFYGPNGAAHIYGPQKGASKSEIEILDEGLKNFSKIILEDFDINLQQIKGSGAAGGLGGGAVVFLNATLKSGIELIKEIADFDNKIKDADWIITGEGKLDLQTLSGKTIAGIVASAKKKDIPVAALCGLLDIPKKELQNTGILYAVGVSDGITDINIAYKDTSKNLEQAANYFAKLLFKKEN
ncbi:glycerate kinase [uncultured Croceitalea sp.]|uniref:glycerate kinase n=1 Tax=uncultured Croceitalea sp. TaxID=1798908 RepID=UPI00374FA471